MIGMCVWKIAVRAIARSRPNQSAPQSIMMRASP